MNNRSRFCLLGAYVSEWRKVDNKQTNKFADTVAGDKCCQGLWQHKEDRRQGAGFTESGQRETALIQGHGSRELEQGRGEMWHLGVTFWGRGAQAPGRERA